MTQALEEGKSGYQGRSLNPRVGYKEKSAEVIVLESNEVQIETAQVSQTRKD
jgi:hypothetical protein